MESNKKVLKKAIIISMGAVVTILTLFLLYGLSTGRVQKTIVKYEALHYMENKYKEKFEIKQILGADKIWKTSWGYEIWMVPKNKPDKDYTSDMEVYVFKKNGKFHDNNYEESKKNYISWIRIRKNGLKNKNFYFYFRAFNKENETIVIEQENQKDIDLLIFMFKESYKLEEITNINQEIKKMFIENHIKDADIYIDVYKNNINNTKKIDANKLLSGYFSNSLVYSESFENIKIFNMLEKTELIRYLIKN